MDKYPIYRKFKNGKEFMKLNSTGILLSVYCCRENHFTIIHTDSQDMIENFHNPANSDVITRDEFEKAYGRAQFILSKANCEQ